MTPEQVHSKDETIEKDTLMDVQDTPQYAAEESPKESAGPDDTSVIEGESKETVSPIKEIDEKESNAIQKEEIVDVNIVPIDYLETVIAYVSGINTN